MEDPETRERESQETSETEYERAREEERATTERVAEDIANHPLTERDEEN